MTERLNELLAKLRELDPETWGKLELMSDRVDIEYEDYCIQGLIQDAIAAKYDRERGEGWRYIIFSPNPRDPGYYAEVFDSRGDCYGGGGDAETPAEALLDAYIAALEAMG